MLAEFSLKLVYFTMVGKIFQIYGFHISRKCIESVHFYSCLPPHLKHYPKFLSSHPRQREINNSPGQHFFENMFPPASERGGGNYNLLYQNSVRKCEDNLDNLFIFCVICNFSKCNGFTVLSIISFR